MSRFTRAYWRTTDERLIGVVGGCQLVGIAPVGSIGPAVIIRAQDGTTFHFSTPEVASLGWHLHLWIQEQAIKGRPWS